MRFEWDEVKNRTNLAKHRLGFATACDVFADPLHLSRLDRVVDGEQRWITIGAIADLVLIVVAHTYRDEEGEEIIRIISARKATKHERRAYESH